MVDDSKGLQKKLVVNTQKKTREEKEKREKKITKKERKKKKCMKLRFTSSQQLKVPTPSIC